MKLKYQKPVLIDVRITKNEMINRNSDERCCIACCIGCVEDIYRFHLKGLSIEWKNK